ncbi:MAG: RNA polymerase sigma factor region1.1 domain-containing protein, partial [Patescibacteria group bacterium]
MAKAKTKKTTKKTNKATEDKTKKVPKALQKDITALFKKAKKMGCVTQDEVLEVFVEPELYTDLLDDFYDQIIANKIDVFESVSEDADAENVSDVERELEVLSTLTSSGVSDPVRMYLKEIGR